MAYAAEVGPDGTVLRVIVIPDDVEDEQAFCAETLGLGGTWKRTHKDRSQRKNFAGPGYKFDAGRDAFIPPKPVDDKGKAFDSWVLDENTAQWKPPKPAPKDGKDYSWDEDAKDWTALRAEDRTPPASASR